MARGLAASVALLTAAAALGQAPAPICPPIIADNLYAFDAQPMDEFAFDVAIDGDTAAISAILAPRGPTPEVGAVYIYKRSGDFWVLELKLDPDDGREGDRFGTSVALEGDTLVIGSPRKDSFIGEDTGQVYVYERKPSGWFLVSRLRLDDLPPEAQFGLDVDVSGNSIVIGAPAGNEGTGGAYIFQRGFDGEWALKAQLADPSPAAGQAFGESVAIDEAGGVSVVGARYVPGPAGGTQGAAYVYARTGEGWILEASLTPQSPNGNDVFGWPVDIQKDTVILGSVQGSGVQPFSGCAYIFQRTAPATWSQIAKLAPGDGTFLDFFGYSVSLDDDVAVVGSIFDGGPAGIGQGSAYLYRRSNGAWSQYAKFVPADAEPNNFLGRSAIVRDGQALIGSYIFQGGEYTGDTAYVLDLGGEPPSFVLPPASATVVAGERALLNAKPGGTPPWVYSWTFNGAAMSDGPRVLGSRADLLILDPALESDAGTYRISISNYCGTLLSQPVTLTVLPCLGIQQHPQSVTAVSGTSATFSVESSGPADRTYQWYRNDGVLANSVQVNGATGPTLNISPVDAGTAGTFKVRITAPCGQTFSQGATLVVTPAVCHGDANRDGGVNFVDITSVLATFGNTYPGGTGQGDANGDGVVGFLDITTVLANFGNQC
jgi:hypothetical protein